MSTIAGNYTGAVDETVSASQYNENFRNLEASSGYQDGYRILSGFTVAIGTGLTVVVAPGSAHLRRNITLTAGQVVDGIPPSVTRYLWLQDSTLQEDVAEDGVLVDTVCSFVLTNTLTNPGGCCLLAVIVSGVSTITSVDYSIMHKAAKWRDQDNYEIGDAFTVDHLNQRVGIGVTAPSFALDIAQTDDSGVIRADGVLMPEVDAPPASLAGHTQVFALDDHKIYVQLVDGTNLPLADEVTGALVVNAEDLLTASNDTNFFLRPNGTGRMEVKQHSLSYFPKLTVIKHTVAATVVAPPDIA